MSDFRLEKYNKLFSNEFIIKGETRYIFYNYDDLIDKIYKKYRDKIKYDKNFNLNYECLKLESKIESYCEKNIYNILISAISIIFSFVMSMYMFSINTSLNFINNQNNILIEFQQSNKPNKEKIISDIKRNIKQEEANFSELFSNKNFVILMGFPICIFIFGVIRDNINEKEKYKKSLYNLLLHILKNIEEEGKNKLEGAIVKLNEVMENSNYTIDIANKSLESEVIIMVKEKFKKDGSVSKQGEGSTGRKPLKWNSAEELEKYIEEYYKWAEENNMKITVTGLAWWIDCSRQTLLNYETSQENEWLKRCNDEERQGYVDTIKRAKRFIEMNYENSLFDKSSTTGAIFTLKNNYNWVDKQEVVSTSNSNNLDNMTDEELQKQIEEYKSKLENESK